MIEMTEDTGLPILCLQVFMEYNLGAQPCTKVQVCKRAALSFNR